MAIGDKRLYVFDQVPYEATGDIPTLPTGVLHFGCVVDDVQTACAELAAAGVDPTMGPATFGELKIAFFEDPGGVRIELIEFLDDV